MGVRKLLDSTNFKRELANDKLGIILDVRMPEEFSEERLCDSINCDYMQVDDFKKNLKTLDKSKHYYLYCMSGKRSAEACDIMEKMNFDYMVDLEGGIIRYEGELCSDN